MFEEKATSIVFLCFAVVVAFFNILLGQYQYIFFIFPFAFSCMNKDPTASIFEILGIEIAASYLVISQDVSTGILIFSVIPCVFFSKNLSPFVVKTIAGFNGVLIFVFSMMRFNGIQSILTHGILDVFLYCVCFFCIWFSIKKIRHEAAKKEAPLDEKYLLVIDELQEIAHEYVETLKQRQKEASNDRPRKNSKA
jgi:hypothetical protein